MIHGTKGFKNSLQVNTFPKHRFPTLIYVHMGLLREAAQQPIQIVHPSAEEV